MPGELWRGVVQAGKETVAGTPVAATRILYFMDPVFSETIQVNANEFATATRDNVRSTSLGSTEVGGTVAQPLSADEILELLAITVQGGVTPTTPTGATNGRLWTYSPGSSSPDSGTFEWHDGVRVWQAAGVQGNNLTIAGNVRERTTVSADLFGLALPAGSLTGALSSRTPTVIQGYETLFYIDAFGSPFGGTLIPGQLVNWSVQFGNRLEREYTADNTRNANNVNIGTLQLESVSFLMRGVPANVAQEITNWKAGTQRGVRLEFGGNEAITGDTPVNEVQSWASGGSPTAGAVSITFMGAPVSIAFNQAAAALQTSLNAALLAYAPWMAGGVAVTGGPWPGTALTVTAAGGLLARDIPLPVVVSNTLASPNTTPAFTVTTPGYSGKKFVQLDIPGVWTAVNRGSANANARAVEFNYRYVYDPTNGFGFRARVQNARTTVW